MKKFHLYMMGVWALALIPTFLWWGQSILFVLFVSLYANFATHFGAWQACRAEEAVRHGQEDLQGDQGQTAAEA